MTRIYLIVNCVMYATEISAVGDLHTDGRVVVHVYNGSSAFTGTIWINVLGIAEVEPD